MYIHELTYLYFYIHDNTYIKNAHIYIDLRDRVCVHTSSLFRPPFCQVHQKTASKVKLLPATGLQNFDVSDSYSGHVRNFTLRSAIAGRGSTRLGVLGDFVTDDGSKISTYGRFMDFLQAAHACEKVGCWFLLGKCCRQRNGMGRWRSRQMDEWMTT